MASTFFIMAAIFSLLSPCVALSADGRTGFVPPVNAPSLSQMPRWFPTTTRTGSNSRHSRCSSKSAMLSHGLICDRTQRAPTSTCFRRGGTVLIFPSSSSPFPDGGVLPGWRKTSRGERGPTLTVAWLRAVGDGDVTGDDGEGLSVPAAEDGDEVLWDGMAAGEEEMIEVREEDMMQEWVERGLDPGAFDPRVLLEMWEAEDCDDEEGYDLVKGRSREQLLKKERQGFQDIDGGDDDVDAIMAAAAATVDGTSPRERKYQDLEISEIPEMPDISEFSEIPLSLEEADEEREGALEGRLSGRAVGIDLGTTNSAVALIVEGKPAMVPNSEGRVTTPSVVSVMPRKSSQRRRQSRGEQGKPMTEKDTEREKGVRVLVGERAAGRVASHPRSTYSSAKRVLGRTKKDAKRAGVGLGALNVDQSQSLLRFKCNALGEGVTVSPEQVSAEILRSLIRDAERLIGDGSRVKRAVVAVPAYFDPAQCAATEQAGKLAGLEKVKLMREPEAAALAYGFDKRGDEIILVFDLGGGTFDVSVLEVGGGIAEVIATSGDSQLGGDDFDQAIADWLADEVSRAGGGDPRSDPVHTRRLIEVARSARERLSILPETEVELPFSDGRPSTSTTILTRAKMESLIAEPLKRVMAPMREAAIMADVSLPGDTGAFTMDLDLDGYRHEGFDEGVGVDVGEQQQNLRRLRKDQSKARRSARDRSRAVRRQVSATAEVSRKMERNTKLRRFPQGRDIDEVVLVGGATKMPCVQRLVAGITGLKPKHTVDPDKAVALGAAVYAGILEGEVEGQEVMTAWQASIYRMLARDRL